MLGWSHKHTKSSEYLSFPQIQPPRSNSNPNKGDLLAHVYPVATMPHDALLTSPIARDEPTSVIKACCVRRSHQPTEIVYKGTNAVISFGAVTNRTDTRTNETECGTCNGFGDSGGKPCLECRCSVARDVEYKGKTGSLVFVDSKITLGASEAFKEIFGKGYTEKAKPKVPQKKGFRV
ncbi:hypothetical protein OCU04_005490 [Sclerotinia nivalis]|uniref:Uncharacterized protein n=1 Tax=Sclerotinia nivalis TaxID=352851 RepID=A0A9X0AQ06_9HELO|nr:hypothetical protein OCU04_005490 [Sclerotinia nivalis]